MGLPVELTWQNLSSWLNLILKVSHQFTHTAGSLLCTSHCEQSNSRSKDSRLISITNNQVKETDLISFDNYFIFHKFLSVTIWQIIRAQIKAISSTNKIYLKKFSLSIQCDLISVQAKGISVYMKVIFFPFMSIKRQLKDESFKCLYSCVSSYFWKKNPVIAEHSYKDTN